jgi:hypothetical protein
MFEYEYRLEHIFSLSITLAPTEVIGPVPEGLRANAYVTGGEVAGPTIAGKLRPVGGDWLTLRRDGVCVLDIRATMETNDGALIYTAYGGIVDMGEDGYDAFLAGRASPVQSIRAAPRFWTAHPSYTWLNRLQCVAIGQVDLQRSVATYDVYALR